MGTPENSVQLKVFVDKKKKKVMFAEAANDFVDTLFSLFTLPLGTIAKLSRKHADSNDIKFGSLTSLYKSVVSFDRKYIMLEDLLINPKNSSASICKNLKVNLDDTEPIPPHLSSLWGFVMSSANFIITDDLNVIPLTLDTIIVLFNSLGVENINLLEERTMDFGFEEFLNLLMWSLTTNNPLTNLVLGGGKPCSSCTTSSTLCDSSLISSNSGNTQSTSMKLLVQKSNKKLLCAQVESLFVDLLFSFLTIPLGAVIRLTKEDDCSSPSMGITNLYDSISSLGLLTIT